MVERTTKTKIIKIGWQRCSNVSTTKIFGVIFSKNVYSNLLVLQCVKVVERRIISEGITPITSAVSENAQ